MLYLVRLLKALSNGRSRSSTGFTLSATWWYSKPLNWCCHAPGPLTVRSPLARKLFWCAYWFGSGGSTGLPLNHQFDWMPVQLL